MFCSPLQAFDASDSTAILKGALASSAQQSSSSFARESPSRMLNIAICTQCGCAGVSIFQPEGNCVVHPSTFYITLNQKRHFHQNVDVCARRKGLAGPRQTSGMDALGLRGWLATVAYVAGWSAIPVLDRRAMDTGAPQHALTLVVVSVAALLLAAYVLIFTDAPADAIGAAAHNAYALGSAAATAVVYVAYFDVLGSRGVLFVVMLQPALLAGQTALAAAVLREPLDRWTLSGVAVMAVGMLVYNGAYLVAAANRLRTT